MSILDKLRGDKLVFQITDQTPVTIYDIATRIGVKEVKFELLTVGNTSASNINFTVSIDTQNKEWFPNTLIPTNTSEDFLDNGRTLRFRSDVGGKIIVKLETPPPATATVVLSGYELFE